jgi:hypothetical protein
MPRLNKQSMFFFETSSRCFALQEFTAYCERVDIGHYSTCAVVRDYFCSVNIMHKHRSYHKFKVHYARLVKDAYVWIFQNKDQYQIQVLRGLCVWEGGVCKTMSWIVTVYSFGTSGGG